MIIVEILTFLTDLKHYHIHRDQFLKNLFFNKKNKKTDFDETDFD